MSSIPESTIPYGKIVSYPGYVNYDESPVISIGVYAPQSHPNHQIHPFIYAGDHIVGTPDIGFVANGNRIGDVVYFNVTLPTQPHDSTRQYTIFAEKGESPNEGYWDSVEIYVIRPDRSHPSGPNRP